jgi:hypothetical protein
MTRYPLGLVKTHFYNIWIQLKVLRKKKELLRFHDILTNVRILITIHNIKLIFYNFTCQHTLAVFLP